MRDILVTELSATYSGKVILLLPSKVWKISIPLEGRALKSSKIIAYCKPPEKNQSITYEDLTEIFKISNELEVQIHHDFDHLDIPVLPTLISDVNNSGTGFEITFQINEKTPAYDDLLEELTSH